jgi:uncharacterized protein (DUF736 family)
MSNYEQKEGQGSLFRNDKKGNEKAPDYRGSLKWRNQTLNVVGWVKDAKNGTKFLSLKIESQDMTEKPKSEENNGDLPF